MRKISLLFGCFICCATIVLAQAKHDNNWTIGYGDISPIPSGGSFGGIVMNFSIPPPSLTLQDYVIDVPLATISDGQGQLIAYSDGCRILNRKHQIMLHGDTISPGTIYKIFCGVTNYPLWQPTLFLPKPGSDSLYYLFHVRDDDEDWSPVNLMYSVVDAFGDGGDGEVVSKSNSILTDSLLSEYVVATRHGNGRDWWVVVPRRLDNSFHLSLLSPDGVEHKGIQDFNAWGFEIDSMHCCSQSAFSTDGSKYFRNGPESLLMLDFDRCTGTLSNPVRLDWDSLPFGGAGVATSPSSRFLYLSSGGTVQQYDLWASDLAASMQVVAVYDGTLAPYPANFFQMMPGPDGKIYIITTYDNNILHVIHSPNSLGMACNVEQHAIALPSRSSYQIPNFANYRLGPLDPPCDTTNGVGTVQPDERVISLQIAPNPTSGFTEVHLSPHRGCSLVVYNMYGQVVVSQTIAPETSKIPLEMGQAAAGLYWVVLKDEKGKILGAGKVLVSH